MISVWSYLGGEQTHTIRQIIALLDEAYWRDRSRHKPNLGLNGKVGHYFSCGRESFHEAIRLAVDAIEPIIPGYECEDWVVNRTLIGGGMPPHIDNEWYLAVSLLCLQSNSGEFRWYENNDLDKPHSILDKSGQLIRFNQMDLVRSVPSALSERYVIIFLYR